MKFGFVFPKPDPINALKFALTAEEAGWDGFFVWEPVWGVDPWVTLGAIAARTERIRLGTLLTPLPVLSPWKVAGEAATLDVLSNGRAILAVGLGAPDTGFGNFGLPTDRRTRAERLDEGLDIITGLWRGQPFNYEGKHYQVRETIFNPPPPPVQTRNGVPHIPVWVVGAWFREKSMRRVVKYDGLLPNAMDEAGHRAITPVDVEAMRAWVDANCNAGTEGRGAAEEPPFRPLDIIVEGKTSGEDMAEQVAKVKPFADAGATWWIEAWWDTELEGAYARLKQGPPRLTLTPNPSPTGRGEL